MKIEVNQDDSFQLEQVYLPIKLVTDDKEEMTIVMRDSGFEFKYQKDWYNAKEGKVELVKKVQISNSDLSLGSYTTTNSSYFGNPVLNGLTCPKCKSELLDSKPNVVLTSYPCQKTTKCSSDKCDYQGYRTI